MTQYYLPSRTDIDIALLTRQLIQLASVNPMGGKYDGSICFEWRVTDYLEVLLRHWGMLTERQEVHPATGDQPARENLLATFPDAAGSPVSAGPGPILLYEVHQDTVPVTGMTIDPFAGTIADGRVAGRGACDIKGGMASMLVAMARLAELPADRRPPVVLACTVNEEHGFSGAAEVTRRFQTGDSAILPRAPQWAVVAEPTLLQVVVAHKGTVRWLCHTHGSAAHSSAPEKGHNAIYDMAHLLGALKDYATHVVPQLQRHPLLGHPTLSVGIIRGGVSVNTVPDQCTIEVDRRVLPAESPEEVHAHAATYLREHLPAHVQLEIAPPHLVAGGLTNANNTTLADTLARTAQSCGHASHSIGVPYGTDAAVFARAGVPTVVFGPGDIAQAHTADEWVAIDQLKAAAKIYAELAARG